MVDITVTMFDIARINRNVNQTDYMENPVTFTLNLGKMVTD